MTADSSITDVLARAETSEAALNEAITVMYADLQRLARAYLWRGRNGSAVTLQPTALVNETYLRLLKQKTRYANRQHFVAIATRVMLRVISDYQRAQMAQKRGGRAVKVTLTGIAAPGESEDSAVLAMDLASALDQLDDLDERKGSVFRLRGIWNFEMKDVAEALDISIATAERDWRFVKSWIAEELGS